MLQNQKDKEDIKESLKKGERVSSVQLENLSKNRLKE